MQKTVVALTILFVLIITGCTISERRVEQDANRQTGEKSASLEETGSFVLHGTVVQRTIEGVFFVIEAEDGTTYDPVALPEHFRKDGLRVTATVSRRDDVTTIRMAGESIEIIDIALREEPPTSP